jgi:hypothetical protein
MSRVGLQVLHAECSCDNFQSLLASIVLSWGQRKPRLYSRRLKIKGLKRRRVEVALSSFTKVSAIKFNQKIIGTSVWVGVPVKKEEMECLKTF